MQRVFKVRRSSDYSRALERLRELDAQVVAIVRAFPELAPEAGLSRRHTSLRRARTSPTRSKRMLD